jgi:hypothetical protein
VSRNLLLCYGLEEKGLELGELDPARPVEQQPRLQA